jgi:hypothetical protein
LAQDLTPADPAVVLELLAAFRRSQIMFTAVRLGVFDALKSEPLTSEPLARGLGCDVSALQRLL